MKRPALSHRVVGRMWPACQEHLKGMDSQVEEVDAFKC